MNGAHHALARAPARMRYARARRARRLNPSIYAHTDPRPWVAAWIAHNSEEDPRPLLEWLARGLGLEVDTLQAILRKARRFQLEHTGPLAELIGLDTEAAEYLRRLIVLQAAEPRDGAQARRSVWEIYAVKQGIAPVELTRIHREAEVRGPVELALLPALPLLLELPGVELSPEGLEPALLLPPSPAALADLIEDWREGARMGLFGLLVLASFSSLVGVVRLAIRHQPIVSIETKERIVKRTAKNPDRAVFAFTRALKAARATLSHAPTPLADNGTLGGAPRDAAREALKIYFRKDETNGFELWSSGEHDPKLIVIYTEGEAARRAIWLGQRADGTYVKNVWELPRGARAAMKEAGQL